MERNRKLLVLFDINKTLVYKCDKKVPKALLPYKLIKGHAVYIRPGVEYLLQPMLCSDHVQVGVYSSMKKAMINETLKALLENLRLLEKKDSVWIFDRDCCVPDLNGTNIYDTIKDLELVWRQDIVRKQGFDKTDTIIVENDVKKASKCIGNLVRMVPFDENDVNDANCESKSVQVLKSYAEYFKSMISGPISNIQEYLRLHPLPITISKYFDDSIENLIKMQNIAPESKEEEKEVEKNWVLPEKIPNKEEALNAMIKTMESVTISVQEQE